MVTYRVFFAIFILLFSGCSGISLQKARNAFYDGHPVQAELFLKECDEIPQKDRLLCHMEKGLILHYLAEYQKSTDVLLRASNLIKAQDQISIKDQSSAVLINDKVATYKGEYSERLWVHTFLMMNFLLQYRYDSALVEAKQALEVFEEYPDSLKSDYFTRALVALCYENMNQWADARIEYEKLSKAMGEHNLIAPSPNSSGRGELVLFISQGRVPGKIPTNIVLPPSIRISVPRYANAAPDFPVTIRRAGRRLAPLTISTNVGKVAQKSLDDRAAEILSRQVLRATAKETFARKVSENNQLIEVMARALFFLLEEADTRSWETLPGSLTLVRIELDAGRHDLIISTGYSTPAHLNSVDIHEGKKVFRSLRF